MHELIVRSLQGTASDIEERHLHEWRRASPQNEREFRELAAVWGLTELVRPDLKLLDQPPVADVVRRAERRRALPGVRTLGRRLLWVTSGAAAAILLVVGGGVTRHILQPRDEGALFAARELTTNAAEMATVRLGDGTVVRLGPSSRLRFGGLYGSREVSLDGRAYFAVAKQEGRTFRVRTSAGDARVLGTRFELRADDKNLSLVVVQGRVEIQAGQSRVDVGAGRMSRVAEDEAPVVVDLENAFAVVNEWVGNVIIFETTPLDQVVQEISEHFDVHVTLTDPSISGRTVTASFNDRTFEDVLTVVCRITDVHCALNGRSATISP